MNTELFREYPMTIMLAVIVAIVAIGGIVVVIVHPETLTFAAYLDDLKAFAIAVAVLGGAKAIKKGMIAQGTGVEPPTPPVGGADLPPSGGYDQNVTTEIPVQPQQREFPETPTGDYNPDEFTPEGVPKYADSGDVGSRPGGVQV